MSLNPERVHGDRCASTTQGCAAVPLKLGHDVQLLRGNEAPAEPDKLSPAELVTYRSS